MSSRGTRSYFQWNLPVIFSEVVAQRCFVDVCSEKFRKIHRKTPVPGSFLIKLLKKEALTQVLSCEFCEISKNVFFYRTPLGDCFRIFMWLKGYDDEAILQLPRSSINYLTSLMIAIIRYCYIHIGPYREARLLKDLFIGENICKSNWNLVKYGLFSAELINGPLTERSLIKGSCFRRRKFF